MLSILKCAGVTNCKRWCGESDQIKASDIAIVEGETPRAPAGLLEAALSFLVHGGSVKTSKDSGVWMSVRRIRELRPALVKE